MVVGKILGLSELNVEILLEDTKIKVKDIVRTNVNEKTYRFEVAKVNGNRISAIPTSCAAARTGTCGA